MRLFSKKNFWPFVFRRSPLFAAFARRSGGEKKGEGEKLTAGSARADLKSFGCGYAAPSLLWLKHFDNSRPIL